MGVDSVDGVMLRDEEEKKCTEMSPCAPAVFQCSSNLGNQGRENEISNRISDEPDYVPCSYKVTLLDIIWLGFSITSHVVDVGFDIYVAVNFYMAGKVQFFIWTVVFIVVPSLATTLTSARWYIVDYKNNPDKKSPLRTWIIRCLALLLQLAPTLRYAESLHFAIKSRRFRKRKEKRRESHYCSLMLKEDSDAALLRVFECFLESAPQLVLQLSILMYLDTKDYSLHEYMQWASTLVSFGSLAWALASFQRLLRYPQPNKDNISYKGMVFQLLWHLMITVSRVVALSCLASKFPHWIILCCSIHILIFYVYLLFKGPEGACGGSILWDKALCLILATIYIFTGIHTRDTNSKPFYSFLYSVYFLENIVLVIVWFCFVTIKAHMFLLYLIPIASIGFFILGIGFMISYYLFFHPKKLSGSVI